MSRRKTLGKVTASALALFMLAQPAFADNGGGGGNGGDVGAGGRRPMVYAKLFDDDSRAQGTTGAEAWSYFTNTDGWYRGKLGAGLEDVDWSQVSIPWQDGASQDAITKNIAACDRAIARADERGRARGVANPHSRVVGMFGTVAYGPGGNGYLESTAWVNPLRYRVLYRYMDHYGLNGTISDNLNIIDDAFEEGFAEAGDQPHFVCLALNNETEPPLNYDLNVSTDKASTFTLADTTDPVNDTIHTDAGDSTVREDVSGNIDLYWEMDGVTKKASKAVTVPNVGDTKSPDFTPADFGFSVWPRGNFWFDVQFPKQGKMKADVDTPDRDARELWQVPESVSPTPEKEIYTHGTKDALSPDDVLAANMPYDARISGKAAGYRKFSLHDIIHTKDVFIGAEGADDTSQVYVEDSQGNKVSSDVTIEETADGRTVSGTVQVSEDAAALTDTYTLVVPTYPKPTKADYPIKDGSKICSIPMAGGIDGTTTEPTCHEGGEKGTNKVTPKPNKSWVLDREQGLLTNDPNWTNETGADTKTFLHGDKISAVVNGRIPNHLDQEFKSYQIFDEVRQSDKYIAWDTASAHVFVNGEDMTSDFDITREGTRIQATAKAGSEFMKMSKDQPNDIPVKLIIDGVFRDNDAYDTNGMVESLFNEGGEIWNNEEIPTNVPPVYTWDPDPHKDVVASREQGGDQSSINGQKVYPGQYLEYKVDLDVRIPDNLGREVEKFAMEDEYSASFIPNKNSLEFWDNRTGQIITAKNYKVSWDDEHHKFTVTFNSDWVKANVQSGTPEGWLIARFDGKIKNDLPSGTVIDNQAYEVLNNSRTKTERPSVSIPPWEPHKNETNTKGNDIDGKVVVQGDKIIYNLTMDATPSRKDLAYDVHKLGMFDDYDENALEVLSTKVVNSQTGEDVTDKFEIQDVDGKLYVVAKAVDSTNVNGVDIKAAPWGNLEEFWNKPINPVDDPIIDQSLMGNIYRIVMTTKVKMADTEGYVIKNQAWQNTENMIKATEIVSNPMKKINPSKDVTVTKEGETVNNGTSVNNGEIALNSAFNYELKSSTIPANRAYETSSWGIRDDFDLTHDQYTESWAVYANTDIYDGQTLKFKKGDLLATDKDTTLFESTWDGKQFTVKGTQAFFNLINTRLDLEQSWTAYTQMLRIAPNDGIKNVFTECYNDVDRPSNEVMTKTPENPAIDVEKWDTASGWEQGAKGDRDTADDALELPAKDEDLKDTEITFTVKNTGDVPLKNVTLTDELVDGTGAVEGIQCEAPVKYSGEHGGEGILTPADAADSAQSAQSEGLVDTAQPDGTFVPAEGDTAKLNPEWLYPGQARTCKGTLKGVLPGTQHFDTAKVTGESIFTGKKVDDSDDWHAKSANPILSTLAKTGAFGGLILGSVALALAGMGTSLMARKRRRFAKTTNDTVEATISE